MKRPLHVAVGYSYIRFSHPSQEKGDSLRRQTEAAESWCTRNNVHLDQTLSLRDRGVSAYKGDHRKNPDRHALAAFLNLVNEGKVPRGSFLIIENLDRLSREHLRPALTLLFNLIEAGVRVVQLKPVEAIYDDNAEPMQLMMAVMELNRGNSESRIKSERVGQAWGKKRDKLREDGTVLTKRLPAWIRERGGSLELVPGRAAVVRRIFEMAADGCGHSLIVKRLTAEAVPPFGDRVEVVENGRKRFKRAHGKEP